MTQAIVHETTRVEIQPSVLTLFDALCNSLVLRNTLPYLPVSGLVNLASTCRDFRYLVYQTPGVFRHLDLTRVKTAQPETTKDTIDNELVWHNVNLIDYLTEDDFYSGPLRGVFSTLRNRDLLRDVQSLILDGLSVTAELCHEIINDPSYSVRLLSIRDVKHMNEGKLRSALTYACRTSRPEGMPRLKALYFFGSKESSSPADSNNNAVATVGAGWNHKSQRALTASLQGEEADAWWFRKGRMVSNPIEGDWANTLVACQGLIAFDAVLCQGPRHRNSPLSAAAGAGAGAGGCNPSIATFAVGGCASCGKSPEGLMDTHTTHPCNLPLLAPPPILSSSVLAATTPAPGSEPFAPRCADCLRERCCISCNKWWCEACYHVPHSSMQVAQGGVVVVDYHHDAAAAAGWSTMEPEFTMAKSKPRISRSCWECGSNCDECIEKTQKICRKCCGGYCLVHNEGSNENFCDWCVSRGRGLTRL